MRLASLNLLHGRSLVDGKVELARLHAAVAEMAPDIVGLQEVDRDQPRSHSLDLTREVADALGAQHWHFVPALIGEPGADWRASVDADGPGEPSYGIGLVSRFPVASWHVLRLPAAPVRSPVLLPGTKQLIWLQDEPRVGLAAVVETPLGTMTVATTHLSFVPVWNGVQLRRLTAWLAKLPGPCVLLGDLNMPPPLPRVLSGWRSLARVKTYPMTEPRLQLDHVLGHGDLPPVSSVAAPALTVSDHRALVIEL